MSALRSEIHKCTIKTTKLGEYDSTHIERGAGAARSSACIQTRKLLKWSGQAPGQHTVKLRRVGRRDWRRPSCGARMAGSVALPQRGPCPPRRCRASALARDSLPACADQNETDGARVGPASRPAPSPFIHPSGRARDLGRKHPGPRSAEKYPGPVDAERETGRGGGGWGGHILDRQL